MLPTVNCDLGGWWPPGCGLVSEAQDGFAGSVTAMFAGILESMASWMWSFISGAFGVSEIGDSDWAAVNGLTNWWIVVMMTPLVIAMVLQLVGGLISQQPRRIGRALVAGAIAVPVVVGAVTLMQQLTRFTDSAANAVLATLGTEPYVVFMRLFGFERAPAGSDRSWNVVSLASPGTNDGAVGSVIVTVAAVAVVWILAFILMCSMIFRSFALLVLAAVAPVALMLMPWERTKSWMRHWCEIVIALLIAKPLAATVLAVAVKLFAESTSFAGLASGAVGMLLACGAPLMALRLVSFAGGELAAAAQVAGGGHVLARTSSFTARQVSRQMGGKLSLSSLGSRGPSPVQSRHLPALASPVQTANKARGTQLMLDAGPSAAGAANHSSGPGRQDEALAGGSRAAHRLGGPASGGGGSQPSMDDVPQAASTAVPGAPTSRAPQPKPIPRPPVPRPPTQPVHHPDSVNSSWERDQDV
ncbi:type IV secretion system protein [Arthrobacter sp. 35W]|uniref:type IV secretion system protein n=1 Tax=Arthrobacter sp. 35W TaxID=1132441 RepID=UPI00040998C9|nr:type IV secretion system protein [Arthrobacter sp. 35W]